MAARSESAAAVGRRAETSAEASVARHVRGDQASEERRSRSAREREEHLGASRLPPALDLDDGLYVEPSKEPRGQHDAIMRRVLVLADVLAAAVGLVVAGSVTGQPLALASVATLPLIIPIMKVGGRYDHDEVVIRKSTIEEIPALMALAATYALAWSLVTIALSVHSSRGAVLVLWASSAAGMFVLRACARGLARRWGKAEHILFLGSETDSRALARRLRTDPLANAEIVGFMALEDVSPPNGRGAWLDEWSANTDDLREMVQALEVDRVVVIPAQDDPDAMLEAVATANRVGVKVSIVPSIFEVIGSAAEFDELAGLTVLSLRRSGLSGSSARIKRAMDVVSAAIGLALIAPLGLLIAILIKLDSPGPVFFRQLRIGRNGRVFEMIKFRSMVEAAEQQRPALEPLNESEGTFKMARDPRVTRVGRFLRKGSLDELPQLINVLRGEMSLVGPRPLIEEEDRRVQGRHRTRLQYAPGMTGPWQVLGPARPPLSEMVKLDYLYGANWSLWSDLKYILRTISHVASRRGL